MSIETKFKEPPGVEAVDTAIVDLLIERRKLDAGGLDRARRAGENGDDHLHTILVKLGIYTVHSEGRSAGGAVYGRDTVVHADEGGRSPYQFLAWGQGRRELFPVVGPREE